MLLEASPISDISALLALVPQLTVSGVLLLVVGALLKNLFVTSGHHEQVVAVKDEQLAQIIKEKDAQLAAIIREKDAQLKQRDADIAQIERLYREATEYAQQRANTLHQEKEVLLKEVGEGTKQMYRFTDVIVEMKELVRELTRSRTGP